MGVELTHAAYAVKLDVDTRWHACCASCGWLGPAHRQPAPAWLDAESHSTEDYVQSIGGHDAFVKAARQGSRVD